jgi:hypothetical protein
LPTDDYPGVDLVPTFYPQRDYWYGDIDGDSVIDVPVGRLPARAIREVVFYVCKEMHYHWETAWGGKKDPEYYSKLQLNSVPDNHASVDKTNWTAAQYKVAETAGDVYNILAGQIGDGRVESLLTTSLYEWYAGDDAEYYERVKDEIFLDLEDGRHAVFGVSIHNSYSDMYGTVVGQEWQSEGVSIPGEPSLRPCETFWFTPECFATSLRCNIRYDQNEPAFINSGNIPVYELFVNRGLLIFGSSGVTWHQVSYDVATMMAERVLAADPNTGHPRPVGEIWKEVFNEIRTGSVLMPSGLIDYSLFGDPMLFIRDVYDAASSTPDFVSAELVMSESPNPFNGQVNFDLRGLKPGGGGLRIYDIRGRLIRGFSLPERESEATISWDGRDQNGRAVASGTYFAVLTNQGQKRSAKVAYIK